MTKTATKGLVARIRNRAAQDATLINMRRIDRDLADLRRRLTALETLVVGKPLPVFGPARRRGTR